MCGIAGELRFDNTNSDITTTKAMCDAEIHRGPDDDGYFAKGPVSLGIRRLAIIDLTKGLYPITNERKTLHLVFNGEIYGFGTLRLELERRGHKFKSGTDAETLVHSYEEWGTKCLDHLNGMFAFAIWDDEKEHLWIARDHFGIKPLYYFRNDRFFVFASEIKPLLTLPGVGSTPNIRIVHDYIASGKVDHTEDTFFDGIRQLRPAHQLLISLDGRITKERYWSPSISRALNGENSDGEVENTRRLFLDATSQQLISDVPVGTCLSGGIDSSSVVCAIGTMRPEGRASTGEWVKTFSAVFPSYPIDESKYAKEVCEAAKAEYNPVEPTANELWEDLRSLIRCQEEPFASTSIYAQYRVMERAKERGITVLLDGQGGDELLCGYTPLYLHYLMTLSKHHMYRRLLSEGVRSFDLISPLLKLRLRAYIVRILRYAKPTLKHSHPGSDTPRRVGSSEDELIEVLESLTSVHGLPALLRYEDKNSMWHSIEARVPFLHKPFFEYVASLPVNRKLKNGWTKYVFRRAMTGILPENIRLRRSKIGFETPEKRWIEKELRVRLQDFFSDPDLRASEFYNSDTVRRLLEKRKLTIQETGMVWRALNLEMWYREFFRNG